MKKSDAKLLRRSKRNLKRRLSRAGSFKSPKYNLDYQVSGRVQGTSHGGVAAMLELARATGLLEMIDASVNVLFQHRPYKESDHMAAIVATVLTGGTCPEDLRRLRQDEPFLDSLDMDRFPDSTTCGDFLNRFEPEDIDDLSGAVLTTTEHVLCAQLSVAERQLGTIDADGNHYANGLRVYGRHRALRL